MSTASSSSLAVFGRVRWKGTAMTSSLSSRLSTRPPRNLMRWTTQPRIHGSVIFSLWSVAHLCTRPVAAVSVASAEGTGGGSEDSVRNRAGCGYRPGAAGGHRRPSGGNWRRFAVVLRVGLLQGGGSVRRNGLRTGPDDKSEGRHVGRGASRPPPGVGRKATGLACRSGAQTGTPGVRSAVGDTGGARNLRGARRRARRGLRRIAAVAEIGSGATGCRVYGRLFRRQFRRRRTATAQTTRHLARRVRSRGVSPHRTVR